MKLFLHCMPLSVGVKLDNWMGLFGWLESRLVFVFHFMWVKYPCELLAVVMMSEMPK